MQPNIIQNMIQTHLNPTFIQVEGDGAHFTAIVVSDSFMNQSRIARQQLVYAAVKTQLLDGSLHALSLKTYTQAEWQALEAN